MDAKRGFVPEDERNFSPEALRLMRTASRHIRYLINEGYDLKSASTFVGNHYLLSERQRLAIMRSVATDEQVAVRKGKQLQLEDLAGKEVWIDGFNTIITLEPSTVKLAGDSAVLDEINSIQLQDTLDLSTFATTYTTSYPIPVPNGIRKLTKESDVQVTVQIYDLETKKLDIEKFVWTGLPADVDVVVESEKVTVLLRGPASLLRRVTPYYVRAEADLSSYAENLESSLMVPIKVTVPSIPGVGAIQDDGQPEYAVIIHLVKKETSP